MTVKLVKFKDGSYGIRRQHWLFRDYSFLDIEGGKYWWYGLEYIDKYCKTSYEKAAKMFKAISNKYTHDIGTIVELP